MAIGGFHNYDLIQDMYKNTGDYSTATCSSTTTSCSASTRPLTAQEIRAKEFQSRPGFKYEDEWKKILMEQELELERLGARKRMSEMYKQPIMEPPRVAWDYEAAVPSRMDYRAVYPNQLEWKDATLRCGNDISRLSTEDISIPVGQEDYYKGLFQYYKALVGDNNLMCYDIEGMPIREAIEFMKSKLNK